MMTQKFWKVQGTKNDRMTTSITKVVVVVLLFFTLIGNFHAMNKKCLHIVGKRQNIVSFSNSNNGFHPRIL